LRTGYQGSLPRYSHCTPKQQNVPDAQLAL
jgi:hypothetical protein